MYVKCIKKTSFSRVFYSSEIPRFLKKSKVGVLMP